MSNKTSRPTVSVIIPCYNSQAFISDCLDSVLCQRNLSVEVICINDFSGDNTWSKLQKVQQLHKSANIKLLNHDKNVGNLGVSGARNHGISVSSGWYLMFLDSDDKIGFISGADLPNPYYLESFRYILDSEPQTAMVLGQLYKSVSPDKPTVPDEMFSVLNIIKNDDRKTQAAKVFRYLNKRVSACATMYRGDFARGHNIIFDKNMLYFEDADFIVSYALRAYESFKSIAKAQHSDCGGYFYNIHNDSAMSKVQMKHSEHVFRKPGRLQNAISYYSRLMDGLGKTIGYDSEIFHFMAKTEFSNLLPELTDFYKRTTVRFNRPCTGQIEKTSEKLCSACQNCDVNWVSRFKVKSIGPRSVNNCSECPNLPKLQNCITNNLNSR